MITRTWYDDERENGMGHYDKKVDKFLLQLEIKRRVRVGQFSRLRLSEKVPTPITAGFFKIR